VDQPLFDDTLELIANLIYLSRHVPSGSSQQTDYLARADEAIAYIRDRRAATLNGSGGG
jgi:hypothetical protein